MNRVTAVVLSPVAGKYEFDGWETLNWVSKFNTPTGLHKARLDSLMHVKTPYYAFVDSDDSLPINTKSQINRLIDLMEINDHAIGYTDCEIISYSGKSHHDIKGEQAYILNNKTRLEYIHHLVVARTEDAVKQAKLLPLGNYLTESILYAPLCQGGASYLPEIGYTWNKINKGLHLHNKCGDSLRNSRDWYVTNYNTPADITP